MPPDRLTDRARGVLLGLACGDALGRPVEFQSPDEIANEYGVLDDMIGDGEWGQPPGTVTDDTDLAVCIARSLVKQEGFDPVDISERFLEWYDNDPFDVGSMTQRSLDTLKDGISVDVAGRQVWEASYEGSNAGNGSLMRCAPHALAYYDDPDSLEAVSRASSRITHYDSRCQYACAILNLVIAGFLRDVSDPLGTTLDRMDNTVPNDVMDAVEPIRNGKIHTDDLETTPYVVHTLQLSLYDALTSSTAPGAIVTSVNRGGDTDTQGAVTGAVTGARFGASELPDEWVETVEYADELCELADELVETSYPSVGTGEYM